MKKKSIKRRQSRTFEGLPVIDADEPIALRVLPLDVKGAKAKSPASCAAARAGQRELNTDVRVFLTRTYVKVKAHGATKGENHDTWVRYKTPESASREIVSFDRGATFEPGDYTFVPLPASNRLGTYRGQSTEGERTKTRKRPRHATAMVRERSHYDRRSR